MYENITYAEIKKLSVEQKSKAWKELKSLYKTQKELAVKLGVTPGLVYNMISRYAKEESGETEEKPEIITKPKRARRMVKNQDKQKQDVIIETPVTPEVKDESFSISFKKIVTGDNAQVLLNGVGSTLLKGQKYAVEIRITEK